MAHDFLGSDDVTFGKQVQSGPGDVFGQGGYAAGSRKQAFKEGLPSQYGWETAQGYDIDPYAEKYLPFEDPWSPTARRRGRMMEMADERRAFAADALQRARMGESMAAKQMQAGLGQAYGAMQGAAVGRGASPLAQRAAIYGGGELMQRGVTQAAGLRAAEAAALNAQMGEALAGRQSAEQFVQERSAIERSQQMQQQAFEYAKEQDDIEAMNQAIAAGASAVGTAAAVASDRNVKQPAGSMYSDKQTKQGVRDEALGKNVRQGLGSAEAPRVINLPEQRIEGPSLAPISIRRPDLGGAQPIAPRPALYGGGASGFGASSGQGGMDPGRPPFAPGVSGFLSPPMPEDMRRNLEAARARGEVGLYSDRDAKMRVGGNDADALGRELARAAEPTERALQGGGVSPELGGTSDSDLDALERQLGRFGAQTDAALAGGGVSPQLGGPSLQLTGGGLGPSNVQVPGASPEMDAAARNMQLQRFEYKPSFQESLDLPGGPRLGVMAQDLEQSPLGRDMVTELPGGVKGIDRDQAIGTSLGMIGRLGDRLDTLEDERLRAGLGTASAPVQAALQGGGVSPQLGGGINWGY